MKMRLLWFIWFALLAVLIVGKVQGWLPSWGYNAGVITISIVFPVILGLTIWFVLAPKNYFFTFAKESTAKIVVKGDKFDKCIIQWEGYTLDHGWNVIEGEEPWHPFGGFRFYGLWPIWDIFIYRLRWHDVQRTGDTAFEKPEFHDEIIDYVLLRPDVYWVKIFKAETGGAGVRERIPVDVEFLTTMRVVNPYKATFVAPIGWVENVMLRLIPVYRGLVADKSVDELLAFKGHGEEFWRYLKEKEAFTGLIKGVFEDQWGVRIEENGVQIKNIDLPDEYQDAAAEQKKQELKAAGRAAEAVGSVIAMLAHARGKSVEKIRAEIDGSPEMRQEFMNLAKDLVVRKLGIEGKSYLDIRVEGAKGFERMLLNALAAWQRMPGTAKKED